MPKTRHQITGTDKELVVEKDTNGNLKSVTDEKGKPADTAKLKDLKIRWGDKELEIMEFPDDVFFVTQHNPTCGWYYYGNAWHYV